MGLVIRVLWRVISPPPGPLPSYSPMTRLAAKAGHLALYLLLFAIGISGYLISTADGKPISVFGWFDVPATLADAGAQADFAGALHFWLAWSVVVLSVQSGVPSCALIAGKGRAVPVMRWPTATPMLLVPKSKASKVPLIRRALPHQAW